MELIVHQRSKISKHPNEEESTKIDVLQKLQNLKVIRHRTVLQSDNVLM